MGAFSRKTREDFAEAVAKSKDDVADFHVREVEKYERKADEAEARGKTGAAKRYRKVAERNRRLAEKNSA